MPFFLLFSYINYQNFRSIFSMEKSGVIIWSFLHLFRNIFLTTRHYCRILDFCALTEFKLIATKTIAFWFWTAFQVSKWYQCRITNINSQIIFNRCFWSPKPQSTCNDAKHECAIIAKFSAHEKVDKWIVRCSWFAEQAGNHSKGWKTKMILHFDKKIEISITVGPCNLNYGNPWVFRSNFFNL